MTPEITADNSIEPQKQAPSTAGMTTKVVKGSMWTLAGSVAPLAISFISTPFIIRFLGTESYGVLLLVGLIPTYFSFADFGMGVASTKFAAEAYGEGDEKKEAEIVWTATAIAAISALIVAIPIFIFSYPIVQMLNVPEHLLSTASIALKITSGSFFVGILSSVLNSPMLARLRMDLNMLTSAGPKVLLAAVTPFILYFGGGIVEAVGWAFIVALGILAVVLVFGFRLVGSLRQFSLRTAYIGPLSKFGFALVISGIAAVLLVNVEKFYLARLVSVQALAYYSVAFTLASSTSVFSQAMTQSLVPAFAQLLGPNNSDELHKLFSRSFRLNLVVTLPIATFMLLVARPFFLIWAGPEFEQASTLPFYLLLVGLVFNLLAYIPYSLIVATGRTQVLAKLYWLELLVYIGTAYLLIDWLGISGAAIAWSARVLVDALAFFWLARRISGVELNWYRTLARVCLAGCFLLLPIGLVFSGFRQPLPLMVLSSLSFATYGFFIWHFVVDPEERALIRQRFRDILHYAKPV